MKKTLTAIGILFVCVIAGSTALAGKYNQSVYDAQYQLKERGYSPGPADGMMGKKTEDAIRKFQKDQGLPATGTLDEKTAKLLPGPTPAEKPQDPTQSAPKPAEKSMASVNQVLKAQQYLQQLGYKPGIADGVSGKKTTDAVKKFQKDRGLRVTGIIDDPILKEMEALLGAKNGPKSQAAPPDQGPRGNH